METGAGEDHGRASTVVTESTPTANYNENQNQAVQPVNICEPKLNSSSSLKSAHAGRELPHKAVDPGHGPQHNDYADTRDV
ncbi:hypothetical protein C5167_028104 [Papaver somniferum]|nr:hypothetical protein C5167_028104 [Papaver somniferum]